MARNNSLRLPLSNPDGVKYIPESYESINRAIAFIEGHYDEEIHLDFIARKACLSLCHFSRMFKRCTGTTYVRYLSSLRIKKAKELLKDTELPVTQICFEVGFHNLTHFERVFKELEGMTPSEYRLAVS